MSIRRSTKRLVPEKALSRLDVAVEEAVRDATERLARHVGDLHSLSTACA